MSNVIVHDVKEAMQLPAGTFASTVEVKTGMNMHLVWEVCETLIPLQLLAEAPQELMSFNGTLDPGSVTGGFRCNTNVPLKRSHREITRYRRPLSVA